MSEFKIVVYAICKNEAAFARRWYESMSEADGVYVLDTGSEDDTVNILRSLGAHVEQEIISPWRFDRARNRSLFLVPEDAELCVCTDLDEVFHPGWREGMEDALRRGGQRLRYRYTWSFLPDGREGCTFMADKAHPRHGFHWVNPVHEVLQSDAVYITLDCLGVQLDHHADDSKARGQYLPLLELAVSEAPGNERNLHYLGREYMFYGRWHDCEEALQRYLAMPSATWKDERSASMRYLARACIRQGRPAEAREWLLRAIAEAPYAREPWLDAAELARREEDWCGALFFARKALEIQDRSTTYLNEAESWGAKPYDIAALGAYYLGLYDLALKYGAAAAALEPEDMRLKDNLRFYSEKTV